MNYFKIYLEQKEYDCDFGPMVYIRYIIADDENHAENLAQEKVKENSMCGIEDIQAVQISEREYKTALDERKW